MRPNDRRKKLAAAGLGESAERAVLTRLRALAAAGKPSRPPPWAALSRQAWSAGREIDVEACHYGSDLPRAPLYYRFLAGFIRVTGSRRVVELGTHCGGSISAMSRGLAPGAAGRLVSVDHRLWRPKLAAAVRPVVRLVADVLRPDTADRAIRAAGRADFLFVDFMSRRYSVLRALELYAVRLRPAYVAIDDIRLNASTRRLWRDLRSVFGPYAFDASDAARRDDPEVSPLRIGLGLIAWRAALSGD